MFTKVFKEKQTKNWFKDYFFVIRLATVVYNSKKRETERKEGELPHVFFLPPTACFFASFFLKRVLFRKGKVVCSLTHLLVGGRAECSMEKGRIYFSILSRKLLTSFFGTNLF